MFGFNKSRLFSLLALLSINTMTSLSAWECCEAPECCDVAECNRFYIGAFGGELFSEKSRVSQMGTAFFEEEVGGPLAVFGKGRLKKTETGFGGAQIGYEWKKCPLNIPCTDWSITPAVELEGFWYGHKKKGHLTNNTDRLPEHDFHDSFRMDLGIYVANAILSFNSPCLKGFVPYVGGGVGAANIYIKNAKSKQVDPPEPGINHFNSRRNDSSWAFAAQAKVGLRYNICKSFHIFGEYRYLFVDFSNYIFGSTVYPTHAPTSPWNVKIKNINYNAFVFGIQYDL
jgi:opacity protein-like surface antigen